ILGIIIGVFVLINSILLIVGKKEKPLVYAINLFCAFGFLATGIGGFFIPEKLDIIPIILLLVFAVIFLVQYYVFLKKNNSSQKHKIHSSKK
ncbi:MAG: hypothetical protein K2J85_03040, partial [Anaeroplasmataceae bacterium]|nr:hypothetical protein [Anaeroplasmataceae bacterium]